MAEAIFPTAAQLKERQTLTMKELEDENPFPTNQEELGQATARLLQLSNWSVENLLALEPSERDSTISHLRAQHREIWRTAQNRQDQEHEANFLPQTSFLPVDPKAAAKGGVETGAEAGAAPGTNADDEMARCEAEDR